MRSAATEVDLSWSASTDSAGVTGYQVERCQGAGCSNFAQIATPTGTTYNDTGVTANNSYSYRVRAVDAAGKRRPVLERRDRVHRADRDARASPSLTFTRTQQFTAQGPVAGTSPGRSTASPAATLELGHDHQRRRPLHAAQQRRHAHGHGDDRDRDCERDGLRRRTTQARSRTTTTTCATVRISNETVLDAVQRELERRFGKLFSYPLDGIDVRLAALRRRT